MISVKFFNANAKEKIINSLVEKILDRVRGSNEDNKIIRDSNNIEITSGNLDSYNSDTFVIEFTIKKRFLINKNDIRDRHKLDKFLFKVRSMLSYCNKFDDIKYKPINMR